MKQSPVSITEIHSGDAERVGAFLQSRLNSRVPAPAWAALIRPPWGSDMGPNHGFQLLNDRSQVVGAYLAVYSKADQSRLAVCNLAAFCVHESYRSHSLRLVRALLRQKGFVFSDLSPSGTVPKLNERLGFHYLDTSTRLVANLERPSRRVQTTDRPIVLQSVLADRDAAVYQDHSRAPAARHLVVRRGDAYAYLMYRRDRRKRLPVFASPLYVGGDPELLESGWPAVATHLLRRGYAATLGEQRVLGFRLPGPGITLTDPRPKMYRGDLDGKVVDYLYSELTLLQW